MDDRKGGGSNKAQRLCKSRRKFLRGTGVEKEKESELSWSGERTANPLAVLSICWGSCQGAEHMKHGLVEKGSAASHVFVLDFLITSAN